MTALLTASVPAGKGVTPIDQALIDAHAVLTALGERKAAGSSEAAADTLAPLRASHPEVRFSLVTERESYDGSTSSALILRHPGRPTVSLSIGSETELPWPLRGVVRSSETDLLAVNGRRVDVAEAMVRLDSMLFDPQPMRLLVDGCLLDEALADEPIELSPADLQAAADAFRRAKRLHRKVDTERWLADRGLTADDFSAIVVRHAELAALRDRVTAGQVDAWFQAHRHELDTLVLAWIDVAAGATPGTAEQLVRDPLSTVVRAAATGTAGGVVQVRADSAPELLEAAPGSVHRLSLEVPAIAAVIAREAAVLDERTRADIRQRLFRSWLADRRAGARVTWFWGDQRRTGP